MGLFNKKDKSSESALSADRKSTQKGSSSKTPAPARPPPLGTSKSMSEQQQRNFNAPLPPLPASATARSEDAPAGVLSLPRRSSTMRTPSLQQQQQEAPASGHGASTPATSSTSSIPDHPAPKGQLPSNGIARPLANTERDLPPPPAPPTGTTNTAALASMQSLIDSLTATNTALLAERDALDKKLQSTENELAGKNIEDSRSERDDVTYQTEFANFDKDLIEAALMLRDKVREYPDWVRKTRLDFKTKLITNYASRAVLARWIAEEIFGRYLHPGIDLTLSMRLKKAEKRLARYYTPGEIAIWRRMLVRAVLPTAKPTVELTDTPEYNAHLEHAASSFLHTNIWNINAANTMPENSVKPSQLVPANVLSLVENAFSLMATMSLETRYVMVTYPLPLEKFDKNRMTIEPQCGIKAADAEDIPILLSSFFQVQQCRNADSLVILFKPSVIVQPNA
ncbi:uncharacterized protein V1518DRAFT_413859 [Limtongia smithiae]|uniref:uncharacterized protein n=1 Tax=Limtongia smithiae TaxID=1125753 RepID=UPI0034D00530